MDAVLPVVVALASMIASLLIEYGIKSVKREEAAKRTAALEIAADAQADVARQVLADLPEETLEHYLQYLVYAQRADGSFPEPPIALGPTVDLGAVEELVEARYSEVKRKVEEMEERFPQEATLDKIASINDAILATNLESLTEAVKRLDEKMLTKWDVARIVFQVLAAVGGVVGLAITIIGYVSSAAAGAP